MDATTTSDRAATPVAPFAGSTVNWACIGSAFFSLAGCRAFYTAELGLSSDGAGPSERAGAARLGAAGGLFPLSNHAVNGTRLRVANLFVGQTGALPAAKFCAHNDFTTTGLDANSAGLVTDSESSEF